MRERDLGPKEARKTIPVQKVPEEKKLRTEATTTYRPMQSLAVVTCFYNPEGYETPLANYLSFRKHMADCGVDTYSIELVYGDEEPQTNSEMTIRGTDRNKLWQKERLLNILIRDGVPDKYDAIAWVDADLTFMTKDWHKQALDLLEHYAIVQLFTDPYEVKPNGYLEPMKRGCGWAYHNDYNQSGNFASYHPGFAWAGRADWIREVGLIESGITGGGDTLMARAFLNRPIVMDQFLNNTWIDHAEDWKLSLPKDVLGSLAYLPGAIIHTYHGDRSNRRYKERWDWLIDHAYDPRTDTTIDPDTDLIMWTDHAIQTKPEMINLTFNYSKLRKEDAKPSEDYWKRKGLNVPTELIQRKDQA